MKKRAWAGVLVAALAGCSNSPVTTSDVKSREATVPVMTTISGAAAYRELILLPPHTELEVTVTGENGEVISRQREPSNGPPYRFSATVPQAALAGTVSVQATLYLDDQVRFASEQTRYRADEPLMLLLRGVR